MTGAEFKAMIPDEGTIYVDGFPIEADDVEIDGGGDVLIMSPEDAYEDDGDEEEEDEE